MDSVIINNKGKEQRICKHNKVRTMVCFRKGSLDNHTGETAKIVVMCLGYSVSFLLQLKDKYIGDQSTAGSARKGYRFSECICADCDCLQNYYAR